MRFVRTAALALAAAVLASCAASGGAGKGSGEIPLFNGKDLAGWSFFLDKPGAKLEDTWSVQDGLIVCKGEPMGYIYTDRSFTDYRMVVEWRWAPGKKPGNSGLFQRIDGEPRALPKTYEVQLQSGNAGDIYSFHGKPIGLPADPARVVDKPGHELAGDLKGVKRLAGSEVEPGQWNLAEITVKGPTISVTINGTKVNEVTGCQVMAGPVGLQSEGGEVHFRKVGLTPLE